MNSSLPFISKLGLAGQVERQGASFKETDLSIGIIASKMDQVGLDDGTDSHFLDRMAALSSCVSLPSLR